ncbi:MAG: PaaI family thioesterase [Pseudomonadota bacterium]|nr:PaaI family thioesterase [Pseudomonadota bacterium]
MPAKMTPAELMDFLDREFPQTSDMGLRVEQAGDGTARVRLPVSERNLRPGGTVSGPTLFWLADLTFYVAVLAEIGPVALAVTTNMSINFLRKPGLTDLIAEFRMLKLGRRLAVGDIAIYSEGNAEPVAHVTGTYSIPPER